MTLDETPRHFKHGGQVDQALRKLSGDFFAEFIEIVGHRGDGRVGVGAEIVVAGADHGELFRNPDLHLVGAVNCAQRIVVILGENGRDFRVSDQQFAVGPENWTT